MPPRKFVKSAKTGRIGIQNGEQVELLEPNAKFIQGKNGNWGITYDGSNVTPLDNFDGSSVPPELILKKKAGANQSVSSEQPITSPAPGTPAQSVSPGTPQSDIGNAIGGKGFSQDPVISPAARVAGKIMSGQVAGFLNPEIQQYVDAAKSEPPEKQISALKTANEMVNGYYDLQKKALKPAAVMGGSSFAMGASSSDSQQAYNDNLKKEAAAIEVQRKRELALLDEAIAPVVGQGTFLPDGQGGKKQVSFTNNTPNYWKQDYYHKDLHATGVEFARVKGKDFDELLHGKSLPYLDRQLTLDGLGVRRAALDKEIDNKIAQMEIAGPNSAVQLQAAKSYLDGKASRADLTFLHVPEDFIKTLEERRNSQEVYKDIMHQDHDVRRGELEGAVINELTRRYGVNHGIMGIDGWSKEQMAAVIGDYKKYATTVGKQMDKRDIPLLDEIQGGYAVNSAVSDVLAPMTGGVIAGKFNQSWAGGAARMFGGTIGSAVESLASDMLPGAINLAGMAGQKMMAPLREAKPLLDTKTRRDILENRKDADNFEVNTEWRPDDTKFQVREYMDTDVNSETFLQMKENKGEIGGFGVRNILYNSAGMVSQLAAQSVMAAVAPGSGFTAKVAVPAFAMSFENNYKASIDVVGTKDPWKNYLYAGIMSGVEGLTEKFGNPLEQASFLAKGILPLKQQIGDFVGALSSDEMRKMGRVAFKENLLNIIKGTGKGFGEGVLQMVGEANEEAVGQIAQNITDMAFTGKAKPLGEDVGSTWLETFASMSLSGTAGVRQGFNEGRKMGSLISQDALWQIASNKSAVEADISAREQAGELTTEEAGEKRRLAMIASQAKGDVMAVIAHGNNLNAQSGFAPTDPEPATVKYWTMARANELDLNARIEKENSKPSPDAEQISQWEAEKEKYQGISNLIQNREIAIDPDNGQPAIPPQVLSDDLPEDFTDGGDIETNRALDLKDIDDKIAQLDPASVVDQGKISQLQKQRDQINDYYDNYNHNSTDNVADKPKTVVIDGVEYGIKAPTRKDEKIDNKEKARAAMAFREQEAAAATPTISNDPVPELQTADLTPEEQTQFKEAQTTISQKKRLINTLTNNTAKLEADADSKAGLKSEAPIRKQIKENKDRVAKEQSEIDKLQQTVDKFNEDEVKARKYDEQYKTTGEKYKGPDAALNAKERVQFHEGEIKKMQRRQKLNGRIAQQQQLAQQQSAQSEQERQASVKNKTAAQKKFEAAQYRTHKRNIDAWLMGANRSLQNAFEVMPFKEWEKGVEWVKESYAALLEELRYAATGVGSMDIHKRIAETVAQSPFATTDQQRRGDAQPFKVGNRYEHAGFIGKLQLVNGIYSLENDGKVFPLGTDVNEVAEKINAIAPPAVVLPSTSTQKQLPTVTVGDNISDNKPDKRAGVSVVLPETGAKGPVVTIGEEATKSDNNGQKSENAEEAQKGQVLNEGETGQPGIAAPIPVKSFKKGDGGTKGIFIGEDGQLYKSTERMSLVQNPESKQFERKTNGVLTNEYEILKDLQGNPNIPKIGKLVETTEGPAFEIETLKEIETLSKTEYRQVEAILQGLNNEGYFVNDIVTIMRRPSTGEIVVVDFSNGMKDTSLIGDYSYEDRVLWQVAKKLSQSDADSIQVEDIGKTRRFEAETWLKDTDPEKALLGQLVDLDGKVWVIDNVDLNKVKLVTYQNGNEEQKIKLIKEVENAIQEQTTTEGVLRNPGMGGQGELQGVEQENQPEEPTQEGETPKKIGAVYRYQNGEGGKWTLESIEPQGKGFIARFNDGHWVTDNIFNDLMELDIPAQDNETTTTQPQDQTGGNQKGGKKSGPGDGEKIKVLKKRKKPGQIVNKNFLQALSFLQDSIDPEHKIMEYFIQGGKISKSVIETMFGKKNKQSIQQYFQLYTKDVTQTLRQVAHGIWEGQPDHVRDIHDSKSFEDALENVLRNYTNPSQMAEAIVNKINEVEGQEQWIEAVYPDLEEWGLTAQDGKIVYDFMQGLTDEEIEALANMDQTALADSKYLEDLMFLHGMETPPIPNPFEESREQGMFFHGTPHGIFDQFDINRRGEGADIAGFGDFGNGIYFTKDRAEAVGYAQGLAEQGIGEQPHVARVFLDIRNPFDMNKFTAFEQDLNAAAREAGNIMQMDQSQIDAVFKKHGITEEEYEFYTDIVGTMGDNFGDFDIASQLKAKGFDAVISPDGQYVVFSSSQTKIIPVEAFTNPNAFEEVEAQEAPAESYLEQWKKAANELAQARTELTQAENRLNNANAVQTDLFGGVQQNLFAVGGEEAKSVLDPLRQKVTELEQRVNELDRLAQVEVMANQPKIFTEEELTQDIPPEPVPEPPAPKIKANKTNYEFKATDSKGQHLYVAKNGRDAIYPYYIVGNGFTESLTSLLNTAEYPEFAQYDLGISRGTAGANYNQEDNPVEQPAAPAAPEPPAPAPDPTEDELKQSARKIRDDAQRDKIKSLLNKFKKGGNNLTTGGLDPEKIETGVALIGEYIKAGVYKFSDIISDLYSEIGDEVSDLMDALRAVYLAYYGQATDEEADQMDLREARNLKYDSVKQKITQNVRNQPRDSQPDSGNAENGVSTNESDVSGNRAGSRQDGTGNEARTGTASTGSTSSTGSNRVHAPSIGKQGNNELDQQEPGTESAEDAAGTVDGRGNSIGGPTGLSTNTGADTPVDPATTEAAGSFADSVARKQKLQLSDAVESLPAIVGDEENIIATLPLLLREQQDDVLKAEKRFFGTENPGKGMLFTNGTGTGKTFTGLGIVKRFVKMGKDKILLVVTASKVGDWQKDGARLGLNIMPLENTKDGGSNQAVTSYENFRANEAVMARDFDLVLYDESHHLMQDKGGEETATSQSHYAISNRSVRDAFDRLTSVHPVWKEHRALFKRYSQANAALNNNVAAFPEEAEHEVKQMSARLEELEAEKELLTPSLKARAEAAAKNTKVVFLSATPFKTVKNLRYAESYLFNWGAAGRIQATNVMSEVDPESMFFLENFGATYQWKYHKLWPQDPANPEAVAMQEIQFSQKLMASGAVSGRAIESNMDYSREFPLITGFNATEFNQAFSSIYNYDTNEFAALREGARRTFYNYHYTTQLFESLKTSLATERIKKHLDLGRKVVVFHRRQQANATPPFASILDFTRFNAQAILADKNSNPESVEKANEALDQVAAFEAKYSSLLEYEQDLDYRSAVEQIEEAFPDRTIHFEKSGKKKMAAVKEFNDDESGKDIIIIQEESGKEGISLHDTTGKHQRVLISLSMPISSITALQIEGRIFRIGNESNAIFEYPLLGLDLEYAHFGHNLNRKLSTTENLAVGSASRDLNRSLAEGVLFNSSADDPNIEQGSGGKEFDKRAESNLSEYNKARLVYSSNQKMRGKRDQREGYDFYPTPEPLGQKMIEWARLRPGERGLEPSAGNGAIAMWMPNYVALTAIEPSFELYSKLGARAGGSSQKVLNQRFEDFNIINKFEGVIMNPPFGKGGADAIRHMDKAFHHLVEGGRMVALIPSGGAMEKKLNDWLYGVNDKGIPNNPSAHLRRTIKMPSVTFSRAGTSVNTIVVIIDKVAKPAGDIPQPTTLDLTRNESINDLFDELEYTESPTKIESAAPPVVEAPVQQERPDTAKEVLLPVTENKHTKTGQIQYLTKVNPANERLSTEAFKKLARQAENNNGFWSRFAKGFLFDNEEDANKFVGETNGVIQTPEQLVAEIKALPLTHVSGLNMGAKQAAGVYISTEPVNRYATKEKPAVPVTVDIVNPKKTNLVENANMQIAALKTIVNMDQVEWMSLSDDLLPEFAEWGKGRNMNSVVTNFLHYKFGPNLDGLNEEHFNMGARADAAKLITVQYMQQGYDALYFPQSGNTEGELIVFDPEDVTFPDRNRFNIVPVGTPMSMMDAEAQANEAAALASKEFGVQVKVVATVDELPKDLRSHVVTGGSAYPGATAKDGTVYLVSAEIAKTGDPEIARKTMLHEIVAHKGLEGAFGNSLDSVMEMVYNNMPEATRERLRGTYGSQLNGLTEAQQAALIGEEYVARAAEGSIQKPSWWSAFITRLKTAMAPVLKRLKIGLNDRDINNLLWRAKTKAQSGALKAARLSIVPVTDFTSEDQFTSLKEAMRMSVSGFQPKEIAAATNWVYDKDNGRWVWYTDVSKYQMNETFNEAARQVKPGEAVQIGKLGELMDAEELYKMFPAAGSQITVIVYNDPKSDSAGFMGKKGMLFLNAGNVEYSKISVIVHEVQHFIQEKTGMESGSNPEMEIVRIEGIGNAIMKLAERTTDMAKKEQLTQTALSILDQRLHLANIAYRRAVGEVQAYEAMQDVKNPKADLAAPTPAAKFMYSGEESFGNRTYKGNRWMFYVEDSLEGLMVDGYITSSEMQGLLSGYLTPNVENTFANSGKVVPMTSDKTFITPDTSMVSLVNDKIKEQIHARLSSGQWKAAHLFGKMNDLPSDSPERSKMQLEIFNGLYDLANEYRTLGVNQYSSYINKVVQIYATELGFADRGYALAGHKEFTDAAQRAWNDSRLAANVRMAAEALYAHGQKIGMQRVIGTVNKAIVAAGDSDIVKLGTKEFLKVQAEQMLNFLNNRVDVLAYEEREEPEQPRSGTAKKQDEDVWRDAVKSLAIIAAEEYSRGIKDKMLTFPAFLKYIEGATGKNYATKDGTGAREVFIKETYERQMMILGAQQANRTANSGQQETARVPGNLMETLELGGLPTFVEEAKRLLNYTQMPLREDTDEVINRLRNLAANNDPDKVLAVIDKFLRDAQSDKTKELFAYVYMVTKIEVLAKAAEMSSGEKRAQYQAQMADALYQVRVESQLEGRKLRTLEWVYQSLGRVGSVARRIYINKVFENLENETSQQRMFRQKELERLVKENKDMLKDIQNISKKAAKEGEEKFAKKVQSIVDKLCKKYGKK